MAQTFVSGVAGFLFDEYLNFQLLFHSNYGITMTFARWRFLIILKLLLLLCKSGSKKFDCCDSDLSRINLRLRAKFGPAGLQGVRAYSVHTDTQTTRSSNVYKIILLFSYRLAQDRQTDGQTDKVQYNATALD